MDAMSLVQSYRLDLQMAEQEKRMNEEQKDAAGVWLRQQYDDLYQILLDCSKLLGDERGKFSVFKPFREKIMITKVRHKAQEEFSINLEQRQNSNVVDIATSRKEKATLAVWNETGRFFWHLERTDDAHQQFDSADSLAKRLLRFLANDTISGD